VGVEVEAATLHQVANDNVDYAVGIAGEHAASTETSSAKVWG
jgi:hypothetical protein